ncbi:MAG: RodZ domain-containing protein [Acidimicrobiales bacterium]
MDGMVLVVAAAAVVVVVVGIVLIVRRPGGDELSSVRQYHTALGTLEHFADRAERPGPGTIARAATAPPVVISSPIGAEREKATRPDPTRPATPGTSEFDAHAEPAPPPVPPSEIGEAAEPPAAEPPSEIGEAAEPTGHSTWSVADRPPTGVTGQTSSGQRFYRRPGAFIPEDASPRGPEPQGLGATVGPSLSGRVPPVPARSSRSLPEPGVPLVFDDSKLAEANGEATPDALFADPNPIPRVDRAQQHALESMNRGSRRGGAVVALLAVLVVLGALAYIGSRRSSSAHLTSPPHRAASVSTIPAPAANARRAGGNPKSKKRTRPSPAPRSPDTITSSTSTLTTGTYPVPGPSYQVTVAATGPCWVYATSLSSGSVLWTGTLQAGNTQVIQVTGDARVELGSPAASMKVGKADVVLPSPLHTPFFATFTTSSAGSTPTGGGASGATPNG